MRRTTEIIETGEMVATYGLSEDQHNYAVEMVKEEKSRAAGYKLKEVDEETWGIWLDDADDEDYKAFLELGKEGDIYTLNDSIGDFEQALGEVVVY